MVTHYAAKDWNPAPPARSPCSRKHMYRLIWSFQWFRGELGESVVVRRDQNQALWHQLNSPCLEEEEYYLWPQEHHPHHQKWRCKRYALGVFFCEGDRTTSLHQRDDGPCTVRARALKLARALKMGRGSWIPAWQWPKTHSQGNKGVAQEEAH